MHLDARVVDTVARVLKIDAAQVKPQLKIGDVATWDSLGQLNLIMEIEAVFDVKFDGEQVVELNSVARIQEALSAQNVVQAGP